MEYTPACTKASTALSPDALMEIGLPVASGATFWIAVAKRRSDALSSRLPRGRTCIRARPSFAIQSATSSGGRVLSVTGPACNNARV